MKHTFTLSIDWEDFGQLMARDHLGITTAPAGGRIERQTRIILDLLGETGQKATFFVLGMLVQHRHELVRAIAAEGHEIALHGYHHIDMRKLSYDQAYEDIKTSRDLVSDIIGKPVVGFRAPYFSVDTSNLYVLEILTELGFVYDSSILPTLIQNRGMKKFSAKGQIYDLENEKNIIELPVTIAEWGPAKIPIGGGSYLRVFPSFLLKRVLSLVNEKEDGMIYMHPYEFDNVPLDCAENFPADIVQSLLKTQMINLRWNLFRGSVYKKMKELLISHNFITCIQKAENVKNNAHSPRVLGRQK